MSVACTQMHCTWDTAANVTWAERLGHQAADQGMVVPGYGYDRDGAAIESYERLYPDRKIVQVPINPIAVGGGGVPGPAPRRIRPESTGRGSRIVAPMEQ